MRSVPDDAGSCGDAYDTHLWDWVALQWACLRCGLIDLAGQRLLRAVTARLGQPATPPRPR